ncbi:Arylsulfatase A [Halomicrobium zhouii]|uniref:Arylsulfatase A n=1 Tax=Halomicrobium zhouii TaxID=767519 RepID=A0A1I6LSU8_9EURY|nr:sulfatase [Halomicrobium zhouii]SFS06545.1 Arylsulfatase A [Halomicrobium zhouii]
MPRNAILITVDCLRYDCLSVAGYDRPVSPTMDALAEEGAFCDQAITTGPNTRTSFPGILCSSYPLMYGGYAQLTGDRHMIAEVFRDRGFRTLGINTNTQLHSQFGWDRGWDLYYDSEQTVVSDPEMCLWDEDDGTGPSRTDDYLERAKEKVYETLDQDSLAYRLVESLYRQIGSRTAPHDSASAAVDRTFQYLDALSDEKPLFLWIHFMEPHSPYVPPKSYRDQFLDEQVSDGELWRINDKVNTKEDQVTEQEVSVVSDLYDASVRVVDDQIGRLIDGLRERGYWQDSVAMLVGDHGEAFGEHGELAHGGRPYDELVRVPLIVRRGNEDISFPEGVTSTIDIAPTLLDATCEESAIPDTFHGVSLDPILRGERPMPDDRTVFSQIASGGWRDIDLSNRITACRTDEWKLVTSVQENDADELFYIPDDQYERKNRAAAEPSVLEDMLGRVGDHYALDAYEHYSIEDAVEPDDLGEQLEALGYIK